MDEDVDLPRELTVAPVGATVAPITSDAGGGVDASFDAWVAGASPALRKFARITTRDSDPADLVQDALVAVYLRWSRWTESGQADAYARRVILNGHVSRWRRWGRRVSVVDPALMTEGAAPDEAGSAEILTARQLLAGLPLPQRAAIFLRFYDDLTFRQIAEVLDCRESTARSHVHRALISLNTNSRKAPPRERRGAGPALPGRDRDGARRWCRRREGSGPRRLLNKGRF